MDLIARILKQGYDIQITSDARRAEKDSAGKKLPNGRDFYGLYNFRLTRDTQRLELIESQWPGFYDYNDLIKCLEKRFPYAKDNRISRKQVAR